MSAPLLAAKLVELRCSKGLSQKEIAAYLGITREAYSHYERNTREPSLETIWKLVKLYQIDVAELINEKNITTYSGANPEIPRSDSITNVSDMENANTLTDNMNHFLKIFSGKNTRLNLTDITKEDIHVLARYKSLDPPAQQEIQDFIQFKHAQNKKSNNSTSVH